MSLIHFFHVSTYSLQDLLSKISIVNISGTKTPLSSYQVGPCVLLRWIKLRHSLTFFNLINLMEHGGQLLV